MRFKLKREQITTVRALGSGNFGQVFNAVYGPLRADVAVKLLKGDVIIFLSNLTVSSCPSPLNTWKGYPWHSSLCHSISIFLLHVR